MGGTSGSVFHHHRWARYGREWLSFADCWDQLGFYAGAAGDFNGTVLEFPFDGGGSADDHGAGTNMTIDDPANDCVVGLQPAMDRGPLENLDGFSRDLAVDPAADNDVTLRHQAARDGKPRLKN